MVSLLMLALFALPARARLESAWAAIPARVPADSIGGWLLRAEARGGPGLTAGEAGWARGQFHYARGEYELAATAFLRASSRLTGAERGSARYGWALAMLALGRPGAARPAFDEAAQSAAPERALARLGSAQCWDAEGEPQRAFTALQQLLGDEPGEAAPAALERLAAIATRLHRDHDADEAKRRLVRDFPRSLEAARAGAEPMRRRRPAPAPLETGADAR
jgi:tetratricopeptide (TPR) repeat protein